MADKPTYEELEQKLKELEKEVSRIGLLERTIKETREHAERIVAIIREPLLVIDADLKVVFANKSFYQVFKVTPQETDGRLLYELGNRQWDIPKLRELIEDILLMNTTFNGYEVEHEFEHIGRRMMQLNARRISGEANKIPLIFLTIEDVTEFKRTKNEFRKSKTMLQSIFDGISDPLILLGKELTIHAINRPTLDYYMIKNPDHVIGKPCFVGLGNQTEICEGCTIHGAVLEGREQTFQRRNLKNPERFEEISLYPVIDDSGNIETTIVRIHDITEKKRLEKQLIQSEKLASIGVLVSGIAHEINNPNNYISVNIPILRDYINTVIPIIDEYAKKHPDLEVLHMPYTEFRKDIFELLDNIQYGSRQIKSIVKELKIFSKPDKDKTIEEIDLKPMFEKVVAFCRSKIGKTVKTFTVNIPENLPEMLIDRKPLEQILINLLINAANSFDQPVDENSRVDLVVSMDDSKENQLVIEVSDNGRGMDEKILEKIFDPFFTTNPSEEGTGLGMYIVHNLIEELGGRIQVESKLGEGSKFTVILDIS
ncbi:MAG: PAS domain-containing protein [Proteobacteria bacterium]|jgi:PAS domain S-box-containing protein|nr:PAS domain-containing protein [Pseudomonadota bacterium]OEU64643.1 MAG: hypothetical protein BA867_01315 [Desulfobacterales bacterium S5133MH16]